MLFGFIAVVALQEGTHSHVGRLCKCFFDADSSQSVVRIMHYSICKLFLTSFAVYHIFYMHFLCTQQGSEGSEFKCGSWLSRYECIVKIFKISTILLSSQICQGSNFTCFHFHNHHRSILAIILLQHTHESMLGN